MKKKFFYLLFSLIIAITVEFGCNFLIRQHNLLIRLFGNSDIFWETYFLNNHESGKLDINSCYMDDPELGWKPKSNFSNLVNRKNFSTDPIGMRNIPYFKHSSIQNGILFIGDSFTEGAEVSDSFSVPAQFQKLRPDSKVFNSGVSGYSHSQMLILLIQRIAQLHPSKVILVFVNDDISRNQLTFNGFSKPGYSVINGKLVLKNKISKSAQSILNEHPFRPSWYLMLRFLLSDKNVPSERDDITVTQLLINEMNLECKKNNILFHVVFLPTPEELKQKPEKKLFEAFENYFTVNAIPFYSLETVIKNQEGIANNVMPGGHWGENMNILIANELNKQ